jgi:hypothetical protein
MVRVKKTPRRYRQHINVGTGNTRYSSNWIANQRPGYARARAKQRGVAIRNFTRKGFIKGARQLADYQHPPGTKENFHAFDQMLRRDATTRVNRLLARLTLTNWIRKRRAQKQVAIAANVMKYGVKNNPYRYRFMK